MLLSRSAPPCLHFGAGGREGGEGLEARREGEEREGGGGGRVRNVVWNFAG